MAVVVGFTMTLIRAVKAIFSSRRSISFKMTCMLSSLVNECAVIQLSSSSKGCAILQLNSPYILIRIKEWFISKILVLPIFGRTFFRFGVMLHRDKQDFM